MSFCLTDEQTKSDENTINEKDDPCHPEKLLKVKKSVLYFCLA